VQPGPREQDSTLPKRVALSSRARILLAQSLAARALDINILGLEHGDHLGEPFHPPAAAQRLDHARRLVVFADTDEEARRTCIRAADGEIAVAECETKVERRADAGSTRFLVRVGKDD
jgi:hypothetical protein